MIERELLEILHNNGYNITGFNINIRTCSYFFFFGGGLGRRGLSEKKNLSCLGVRAAGWAGRYVRGRFYDTYDY